MNNQYPLSMAKNIILQNVEEITPYAKNARTHSEAQVSQIASSIIEFGFTNPILVDSEQGIIAGHGRLMADKKLGMTERLGDLVDSVHDLTGRQIEEENLPKRVRIPKNN